MIIEEFTKLVESKRYPIVINRGVTPLSLLGIAFIVMKVMGYITWSWVWVLAPFWIPLCLAIVVLSSLLFIIGNIAKNVVVKAESIKETIEDTGEKKKTKRKSKKKSDGEENSGKPKEENV